MLRMMFGEPPRKTEGKLLETMKVMEQFAALLHKRIAVNQDENHKLRKYEIWTLGLLASLDELEQSQYAAQKFAAFITSASVDEMSPEELLHYHRHVYFDKNAFIRLFSLLDKLGTLMNEIFSLQTERVKVHFSYFTVLRTMDQRHAYPQLTQALTALKEKYKEATARLRKRRNTEIHYMNAELQDDLKQSHEAYGELHRLENLAEQTEDLAHGFTMVMDILKVTFEQAIRQMRK
ncbi:Cthe_2314 family HEPN domain-containing protein [Paenibacillus solisilvae]|uniref:Cthe_2314 family HEPN domain-containing protein n=1 Tax=Paenibacillus solisilvae TaxID=2486751 RepID=A0ABW0W4R8_9BACL